MPSAELAPINFPTQALLPGGAIEGLAQTPRAIQLVCTFSEAATPGGRARHLALRQGASGVLCAPRMTRRGVPYMRGHRSSDGTMGCSLLPSATSNDGHGEHMRRHRKQFLVVSCSAMARTCRYSPRQTSKRFRNGCTENCIMLPKYVKCHLLCINSTKLHVE